MNTHDPNFKCPVWATYSRPNATFTEDHVYIHVSTYHNDPLQYFPGSPSFGGHVNCTQVWDRFDYDDLLNQIGLNDHVEDRFKRDDANEALLKKAFDKRFEGIAFYDMETAFKGNVYHISGSASTIRELLHQRINAIHDDEYWASGDDSYYDYAPDEIELIYQIARAVNAREMFEDFYKWAKEGAYANDDEGLDEGTIDFNFDWD